MLFFRRLGNLVTAKKGIVFNGRAFGERASNPICFKESIKMKCIMRSEMKTKCNYTFQVSKDMFDHFKMSFNWRMHELRNTIYTIRLIKFG